jgi:DNA-binding NarL/FixJ family response regulator
MDPTHTRSAVLLDPHPLWIDAVERLLATIDVTVVGRATAADGALRLVEELKPDLFVFEIGAPDGDLEGAAWVRVVREEAPDVRLVVLSAREDPRAIEVALSAGADAYVVKTARGDDLVLAVRQVFDRSVYLGGATRRLAGLASPGPGDSNGHRSSRKGTSVLTKRELQILSLVAEGHSNADLARMLWVAEQTVKFHLSNIYRKLGVSNRTEASRWAQTHDVLVPRNEEPPD